MNEYISVKDLNKWIDERWEENENNGDYSEMYGISNTLTSLEDFIKDNQEKQ